MTRHESDGTTDEATDDLREFVADLADRVETLEDERDELRDELEREREARREREDRIKQLECQNDALASEVEDLRSKVADLAEDRDDLRDELDTVKREVWNFEDAILGDDDGYSVAGADMVTKKEGNILDRLEDVERAVAAGEAESAKAFASEDPRKMLPVEKLAELPDGVAKQQLDNHGNRNLYRARYIWENWDELAYATGDAENRGSHLKSADVKRTLNTWDEEDTHVESKTVERVFQRLEEWSFWICETRHKSGERRLWRPGDWRDQREDARDEAELRGHHLAGGVVSGAE